VGGFNPGDIRQDDLLPALSYVYTINDTMNFRAAYGRTIARPQYRELAAITIVTPFLQQTYTGNADIQMSTIDNFDARWEWFPRPGEIVAVSAFYKDLKLPIEVAEQTVQGRTTISPQNADSGKVYGIEFEFRQALDVFSDALKYFTVGMNFALMESEVGIPDEELQIIRNVIPDAPDKRDLLEQSPYTFNADVTWYNYDTGTTATLAFNVIGDRLSLVTNGARPDIMERSRPLLDFIFSQELGERWKMKLSVKNILGEPREKSFDDFTGNRYFYSLEDPGTTISLGFGYEFY
jgi:TonB-dependent receptor